MKTAACVNAPQVVSYKAISRTFLGTMSEHVESCWLPPHIDTKSLNQPIICITYSTVGFCTIFDEDSIIETLSQIGLVVVIAGNTEEVTICRHRHLLHWKENLTLLLGLFYLVVF